MKNVDSLKIASKFLKSEREKRGITIEEVSFELKLEKNLIIDNVFSIAILSSFSFLFSFLYPIHLNRLKNFFI